MAKQNRSDVVLAAVLRALKAKRDQEAVRLLVDGLRPGMAPSGADISKWLARSLGQTGTSRLIRALAFYPCFYCDKGLQRCTDCRGKGKASRGDVCDTCIGLKLARCDFCDAAGWATYSFVPCGLRQPVILQRVHAAVKELEAKLKQPTPKSSTSNGDRALKSLGQELLALNRIAGIFENAVDAARRLAINHPECHATAVKIHKTCQLAWRRIESRMRETLLAMANTLSDPTGAPGRHSSSKTGRDRAAFYLRLSRSKGFNGTSLSHPFLMRLAKRTSNGKRPAGAAQSIAKHR